MNLDDVGGLPTVLTTKATAGIYGVSVDTLWKLAREGKAPVEPIRLGRKLVWPTALVLRSLGLDPERAGAAPDADVLRLRDGRTR